MSSSAKGSSSGKQGRTPPHSLEAEQALLGAMLLHENAVGKAVETLRSGRKFYSAAHRKIYDAISAMFENRIPADLTTVAEADVELVFDPPWGRHMMSEAARLETGML